MEIKITPVSARQALILEKLLGGGKFKRSELGSGLSEDTVLRDLTDLLNKKIVRKFGKTKSSCYGLAPGCVISTISNISC